MRSAVMTVCRGASCAAATEAIATMAAAALTLRKLRNFTLDCMIFTPCLNLKREPCQI
jgi:hypothetical protein